MATGLIAAPRGSPSSLQTSRYYLLDPGRVSAGFLYPTRFHANEEEAWGDQEAPPKHGLSISPGEALLEEVLDTDKEMYRAERAGKDRVPDARKG